MATASVFSIDWNQDDWDSVDWSNWWDRLLAARTPRRDPDRDVIDELAYRRVWVSRSRSTAPSGFSILDAIDQLGRLLALQPTESLTTRETQPNLTSGTSTPPTGGRVAPTRACIEPRQYARIQDAIDDAECGATIVLVPGTHRETLEVDMDLTIIAGGTGSPTRIVGEGGPALLVMGGLVECTNLELASDVGPVAEVAHGSAELVGCDIDGRGELTGVVVEGSLTLRQSVVRNCAIAVELGESSRVLIDESMLIGNSTGVVADRPDCTLEVRDSRLHSWTGAAVRVTKPGTVEVARCSLEGGGDGAAIEIADGVRSSVTQCEVQSYAALTELLVAGH
jgi:hypothetical protein